MLLANDVKSSPRPRPPARTRRAFSGQYLRSPSSTDAHPPPAYDSTHRLQHTPSRDEETTSASSRSPTKQIMEVGHSDGSASETANWLTEKSREELSFLLLRAKEVIDERDKELGMTSAVCKSLLDHNVLLKAKHDALLDRLPTSEELSPLPSPSTKRDVFDSPPDRSTLTQGSGPRVSTVSRDELARLADQNAELLSKLEKLEEESNEADKAGKRRLRELEKDITSLRDELQRGHTWVEETVRRAITPTVERPDERKEKFERRRKDREIRVKKLKARTRPWDVSSSDAAPGLDFAPSPELGPWLSPLRPATPSTPSSLHHASGASLATLFSLASKSESVDEEDAASQDSPPSSPILVAKGRTMTRNKSEIVSRLMSKIRELEETNEQLTTEHRDTLHRLYAARKEAVDISRIWEELGDEAGVELEMIIDPSAELPVAGPADSPAGPSTIRFRSSRRTKFHAAEDSLDALGNQGLLSKTDGQRGKIRKGLAGLFESPALSLGLGASAPSNQAVFPSSKISQNPLQVFPVPEDPASSSLTLVNELGEEQVSLMGAGDFRHVRTTSIYDLARLLEADGSSLVAQSKGDGLSTSTVSNDGTEPRMGVQKSVIESSPASIPAEEEEESARGLSLHKSDAPLEAKGRASALVLEVWLWLQFIIIILVFVYMMAKRGPQSVLGDQAVRRRAVERRGTR